MTRADRAALVVVVCLLGAFLVLRGIVWVDPVADNRHRFHFDFLKQGSIKDVGRWVGRGDDHLGRHLAHGDAAPIAIRVVDGPPRRHERVFQSASVLPRDRWGNRWQLVHSREDSDDTDTYRIYSMGPNGRFEWGEGDDLLMRFDGTLFDLEELGWWPLAVLAGLVALPYLSVRMLRLPRRKTLVGEACIASLAALGPVTLAFVVVVLGFTALDSLPLGWGVLPPRFVVFFTVAFVVWLLILGARLRLKAP